MFACMRVCARESRFQMYRFPYLKSFPHTSAKSPPLFLGLVNITAIKYLSFGRTDREKVLLIPASFFFHATTAETLVNIESCRRGAIIPRRRRLHFKVTVSGISCPVALRRLRCVIPRGAGCATYTSNA